MRKKELFQACALGFPKGEENPPCVVAKGEFASAEVMIEVARRYGVPVVEREELCESLHEVPLDHEIPETLFEAAAALLAELRILTRKGFRLTRR